MRRLPCDARCLNSYNRGLFDTVPADTSPSSVKVRSPWAILLYLPSIDENKRREQALFWREFEAAAPQILGALLDVISSALRQLPTVQLPTLPRMADFAKWACAAASACGWAAKDFLDAYTAARQGAQSLVVEASLVAGFIEKFMATQATWQGTATELLTALESLAMPSGNLAQGTLKTGTDVSKHKSWPKNGTALSNRLRRLAPTLRAATGITIEFGTRTGKRGMRIITVPYNPTASFNLLPCHSCARRAL